MEPVAGGALFFADDEANRLRFRRGLLVLVIGVLLPAFAAPVEYALTEWLWIPDPPVELGAALLGRSSVVFGCFWLTFAPSLKGGGEGALMRRRLIIVGAVGLLEICLSSMVAVRKLDNWAWRGSYDSVEIFVLSLIATAFAALLWHTLGRALHMLLSPYRPRLAQRLQNANRVAVALYVLRGSIFFTAWQGLLWDVGSNYRWDGSGGELPRLLNAVDTALAWAPAASCVLAAVAVLFKIGEIDDTGGGRRSL